MKKEQVNNNELPSVRRSCGDCVYCRGYISLWCMNPEAVKARGTAIPGIYHCPHWHRSRWYDDGWLDIPKQPHRLLRLIRYFLYLIKSKIKVQITGHTNNNTGPADWPYAEGESLNITGKENNPMVAQLVEAIENQ